MLTNELKAIEVLMKSLVNNTSLRKEASSSFINLQNFENAKLNLFNIISINELMEYYDENPSFSLEFFLFQGIIPGLYEKPSAVPVVDAKFYNDVNGYYRKLFKALKEGNYVYDENSNVFVSSEEIETIIPQIWLYRLANAFKKNAFKEMFMYNKKSENNILDVLGLIDYLRHTKTFLVSMSAVSPNTNLKVVFDETRKKTIEEYRDKKEVKVDEVMATFKSLVPNDVEVEISKYKLADAFWLVNKAEKYKPDFYSEPLEVQQRLINKWLIEFINSNEVANRQTQKYVLASSLNEEASYRGEDIPKGEVIAGLFNLYMSLIKELDLDYTAISLSDFHLLGYASPSLQANLAKLNEMIKVINKEREIKIDAKDKATEELAKLSAISDTDVAKKEMRAKKYQKALEDYQAKEAIEDEHQAARNQLQALITEEQKTSLANIAFDNDKIMSLIIEAIKKGRVYANPKGRSLYIELYNDTLGKSVFKASITFDNLVEFITNLNLTLDDFDYSKRI